MARRRESNSIEDDIFKAILGIAFLFVGYIALLYYTNRAAYWHWLIYGTLTAVALLVIVILCVVMLQKLKVSRFARLQSRIKSNGLDEEIANFVTRFGRGERTKSAWEYRGYKIDWHRFNEVIADFRQKGVPLTTKEFSALLRRNIDERENNFTLKQIGSTTRDFKVLNGSDFERLLKRLYEKMGYTVQLTGRTGDQGGDLVAIKGPERLLIQAKCYKDMSVGNDAIQQAFAAKTHYDCNTAAVVTTSDFTREALELSRSTSVELIAKKRLQELLTQYLSENWN